MMVSLSGTRWSIGQMMAFRFLVPFFLLYTFPFPYILSFLAGVWTTMWREIVPWVGEHMLQLDKPITIFTNGSGDTTYDYVRLLCYVVIAIVAACVWTLIDWKRPSYNRAHYWFRVLLRYYLLYFMFVYGFSKVFHLQMPSPYLSQLIQPFGEKSPMGLAWSYVGFSPAFSAFAGWSEVIAGFFLLFRRTTTLGAMLTAFVMLNVVVMNFCFDIPVKLFSSILLFASLVLLAADANRLVNFFVRDKPVGARAEPGPVFRRRWVRMAAIGVKTLFVVYLAYTTIWNSYANQKTYGDKRPLPPLYGLYTTEVFIMGGDTIPPLTTDSVRWRYLVLQREGSATVKLMNDSLRYYALSVDTLRKTATFSNPDSTVRKSALTYEETDDAYLILKGQWNTTENYKPQSETVYLRLRKIDPASFRLVSTGFRWINEYPYNR